jgi:hypothetical protein
VIVDVPADTLDIRVPNQCSSRSSKTPSTTAWTPGAATAGRDPGRAEATCCGSKCGTTARAEVGAGCGAKPAGTGIGLSNTRARLHELYGPKSALELADYPAGGTRVSLLIRCAAPCEPVV